MTTNAASLLHAAEIPQATVSETKLVGEAPPDSGPAETVGAPQPVGAAALADDWPSLTVLSRRYIGRALHHTQGNKTRAAEMLGIDWRTLNRIMVRERARKGTAGTKAPSDG